MFGTKELDERNTYNPNLQDIYESALRTYGEANAFFEMVELYLKNLEKKIFELTKEEIYDKSNAIASDLAKCCEMYLKALYIFENNIEGKNIDEIWNKLMAQDKNDRIKRDENGNKVYYLEQKDGSLIYTYVKVDEKGNNIVDTKGNPIFVDKNGNEYSLGNQGKAVTVSGHQLDRLIDLLSLESRLLLETRILTIPMETTEKNTKISILDLLREKGIISSNQQITQEQYNSWLEQHKKTFEEARYSGQKQHNINIEFLHHLATQIKAVVQYKISPKNNQIFTITDDELSKLSVEIQQLSAVNHNLLSEKLIKLVASDKEAKEKIITLLSKQYINYIENLKSNNFYKLIKDFDLDEIFFIAYLCHWSSNYDKLNTITNGNLGNNEDIKKILVVVKFFNICKFSSNQIVELCIQLKSTSNQKIDNQSFIELLKVLSKLFDPIFYYNKEKIIYKKNNNEIFENFLINNINYKL